MIQKSAITDPVESIIAIALDEADRKLSRSNRSVVIQNKAPQCRNVLGVSVLECKDFQRIRQ